MKSLLLFLTFFVATSYALNHTNDTNDTNISSGSGMSCSDIVCTGGDCIETMSGPMCRCPRGKRQVTDYLCEECPVGYWGDDCSLTCAENCGGSGRVSSCDAVDGTCICNSCWMKNGGTTCNATTADTNGFQCFVDFLGSIDKSLDPYGGEIPQPDDTKWRSLAANLLKASDAVVQTDSAKLTVIDRTDVGARQLARFSFTVLNQGSTDYNNAINSIKTDIKDGDYRATLIIDESDGNTGKVTVNV